MAEKTVVAICNRVLDLIRVKASELVPHPQSPSGADASPESWRPVVGWDGLYEVSDQGGVRGCRVRSSEYPSRWVKGPPAPLKLRRNRTGYLRVVLCRAGHREARMVHHLVLEAFVGPRPDGTVGCHANDNRWDNRLPNLRWASPESNWADRRSNGRCNPVRAESHGMAKLTWDKVALMREMRSRGVPLSELAAEFGITPGYVCSICRGKAWREGA